MKTTTLRSRIVQTLCVAAFAIPVSVHAQSGSYTNELSDPVGLWSDTANWLGGTVADGSGNTATFSNILGVAVRLNLDSSRTIGNLTVPQTNYTIYNNTNDANILTLASGTKPVITVAPGVTATLERAVLAGTGGFVVDGGGIFAFFKQTGHPANTISGNVILTNNSTLAAQEGNTDQNPFDLAYDTLGSITFYGSGANGSTFNCLSDASTAPGYGTVDNAMIVPAGQVGTIILSPRVGSQNADNAATAGTGYGGTLTGGGTFNVVSRYVRGNVAGDWSAFTGQINITPGSAAVDNEFRFGLPYIFTNASVDLGGTTPLAFNYYRSLAGNSNIVIGVLSGANPTATIIGSDSAAFTLVFEVNAKHTSATDTSTLAANILNGAGPARLVKKGAGTLILTGTNSTYTGGTVVESGILQVGDGVNEVGTVGNGVITNNSTLVFSRAGSLNVPGVISGSGVITNNGVAGSNVRLTGASTYTGATYVNSGKLSVGTASRSPSTYTIANGASLGVILQSAGGTLTNSSVTFGTGCSYDYDMTAFAGTNAPVVTNTGTVTLNGNVTVNVAGDELKVGTITLLEYGTRAGAGAFVLGTLPAYVTTYSFNDDTVNKRVTLTITVITDPTLRYVGDANGIWDIGNTANQIWVEVGSGIPTNYYDGARVRFDDSATGTTTVTLGATVSPLSIIVSNTTMTYTFTDPSGSLFTIAGSAPLTKLGTNQLIIADLQNNTYSGVINIESGILRLGDGTNNASLGNGPLTNNSVVILDSGGSQPVIGFLGIGPTIANPIHGTGSVVQVNTNVLSVQTLMTGASTYSGGLTVKPGANIGYNNGNAAGIGGGLTVDNSTVTLGANPAATIGNILVTNGTFVATANRVIGAPIVVTNSTITFNKSALITVNSDMNTIVGTITNVGTGGLRFNDSGANTSHGSSNALWVLATAGGFLQPRNPSVDYLGAVEGIGTLAAGQSAGTDPQIVTYNIGGLNTDSVFQGVIRDGDGNLARRTSIIKVGTGTLVLSNATLSLRSMTRVNSGTLALKGTSNPTETTNVTVAAPGILDVTGRTDGTLTLGSSTTNQALMGDGTIVGDVILNSSARLSPGFSIGILTNAGTFTIGGVSVFELDGATTNSDRLVATTINYGGTLILTNIGGTVAGTKTYKLFEATTINPPFSSVVTQAIAGVTWDLSALNTAGTVTLIGSVTTTSTNITITTLGGTNLALSWPDSHTGWTLETNAVGLPTTNWFPVPNSQSTNQVILNIDKNRTNALFFRMRLNP